MSDNIEKKFCQYCRYQKHTWGADPDRCRAPELSISFVNKSILSMPTCSDMNPRGTCCHYDGKWYLLWRW